MRAFVATMLSLAAWSAQAQDIDTVLERSQQLRLDALPLAAEDSERARVVRASFETVLAAARLDKPVQLRVITGAIVAETLQGGIVVANEVLADLGENERRFVLAHEIGHVALGHWQQMGRLYRQWVPGIVRQEQTDSVAALLGSEASRLSHRQEFEADAPGPRILEATGGSPQDALTAFMRLGAHPGSPTHPSTRHRVAALRSVQEAEAAAAGR